MAYPTSSHPFGGDATTPTTAYSGTFIPEIWSGKIIEKFYATTVLSAISNTDYEGEIKNQGDKVKIRTRPTITIRDYDADQPLRVERPSSNIVELTIDKGKYFNTVEDDVMAVQSDIGMMNLWSDDAAQQMKITIDTEVLAAIYSDISAYNKGATAGRISGNINLGATSSPISLTSSNAIDKLIDLGQALDELNIPETGRWVVIPAWYATRLKKSDLKDASITGDGTSVLRNGRLGMIDRFTLYSSNLLPQVTDGSDTVTRIYAGHSHGLTFAAQMTKMETLRSEQTFGTLMRGLQIYGYKVLDGTALAQLYAKPA